jgi:hypothetical protein
MMQIAVDYDRKLLGYFLTGMDQSNLFARPGQMLFLNQAGGAKRFDGDCFGNCDERAVELPPALAGGNQMMDNLAGL